MNTWDNNDYQRIEQANIRFDCAEVLFENGDNAKIPLKSILPENFDEGDIALTFTPYEITFANDSDSIVVPWSKIRILMDIKFSRFMAERAEAQAKEIGRRLKSLRERKNIKGNELAERAGVTAQTISRIERGHTDVSFGTLRKILAAMGTSLRELADHSLESEVVTEKSFSRLLQKLSRAGIDSKFLSNKLMPQRIDLERFKDNLPPLLLDEIVSYVKTVFNWSDSQIWGSENLTVNEDASRIAFYKRPANSNIYQIKAYSHYAYYLSKLVLKATPNLVKAEYPSDIEDFRKKFKDTQFTFENCVSVAWEMGICIIPLRDSGIFHGASWNINDRHVIILKQTSRSQARWLYDLLHELYHVFAHLDDINSSVIEAEEIGPLSGDGSTEEAEANSFAHKVLFNEKTEEIVSKCLEMADYKIENLKRAVLQVSKDESIGADILSNYLAYRLSYQGENWWGTANGLQLTNPDPYDIAVSFLRKNLSKSIVNPIEANILAMAINNN